MAYRPLTVKPLDGGDLVTDFSSENAGPANYVIKRDWRRITDGEVRREGHIPFEPNPSQPLENQPYIGETAVVNLIHFSRKPNGETAIIAGTANSLYRYFSYEIGMVYEAGTFDPDVFQDLTGAWLKIGENFTSGNRWEAKDVAGRTVFSNGVDLPVIYDLDWLAVRPMYELREQGIAFVGTIEEFNGMLVCGDIAELTDLSTVMTGRDVSSMSQTGAVVTSTVSTFTSDDAGKMIVWGTGQWAKIVSIASPLIANVDTTQTVALGPVKVATLYGPVTDSTLYSRVQYRTLFSDIGEAEDFASSVDLSQTTAGSYTVTTTIPAWSFNIGDTVVIAGGTLNGAALTTTITNIGAYHTVFTLEDPILNAASDSTLQKSDRVSSTSMGFDLQDDGSAIIRMMELQGRLVVFKDDSIFLGQFTGTSGAIMAFQKVYGGPASLYWKHALCKVRGSFLVYAGRHDFYIFDLSNFTPKIHDKLSLCSSVFFGQLDENTTPNEVWAADNVITDEIWFRFPSLGADHVLCYDYLYNTCSTVGWNYEAAGSVKRPVADIQVGATEDWFIFGDGVGTITQYGLTNLSSGIWAREGDTYSSILKSGLVFANDDFDEKDLRNYVAYFGDYPETPVVVTLYGARNAHETPVQLFQRTIDAPTYKTLIPTYFRKNYYQDELKVTGQTTNAKVIGRTLELAPIDTRGTIRNNST